MAVAAVLAARARFRSSVLGDDPDDAPVLKLSRVGAGDLHVRADKMSDFLTLERDLAKALIKVPPFCLCMILFIIALCEFSPPLSLYNVHRHLIDHYELESISSIHEFHDVYLYIEKFAHHNEEMQATSYKYWCEHRYSVHSWDEHLEVPIHRCPSPRQYALSLISNSAYKWSVLNGSSSGSSSSSGGSSSSSSSSSSGSGSSGRRLAGTSGASSGSSGGGLGTVPPCEDDEVKLRQEENDPNITCAESAVDPHHMVCDHDLGLLFCPKTCGYCAVFHYDHLKRFEKPQVTMLPVMVHQTRFKADACHGFAHTYEMQPYNPVLTLLPALDGARNARVLECFDRNQYHEEQYAFQMDCTPDTPPLHCHNGKVPMTEKHTYHGDVIYPKLLVEPHKDILRMEAIEWVDVQTEAITVSTVIYTEDLEIFTSLSVEFKMDEAGNVDGTHTMISYRDMIYSSKATFIGCLVTCALVAAFFFVVSALLFIRNRSECKCGYQLYELISWGLLALYPIILLISWSQQIPMATEYDHLLHTFLDMTSIDHHAMEDAIQTYFDTKTIIYEESGWLMRHRVVAYIVVYVQFLQLVFYCNAHPRMAVLTETVARAASSICHFLALFGMLYIMLAFMAHWMLGPEIPEFGTFGETIKSQLRVTFGEFLKASRVDKLDGSTAVMYWIFAITFMVVIWLTLLNFFLAIIVDAFVSVKEDNADSVAQSFPADLFGLARTWYQRRRWKWPPRGALLDFFDSVVEREGKLRGPAWMRDVGEEEEERKPTCTLQEFLKAFPDLEDHRAMRLLFYYYTKSDALLAQDAGGTVSKADGAFADVERTITPPGSSKLPSLREAASANSSTVSSLSYSEHPVLLPGNIAESEEQSLGMHWC